MSVSNKLFHYNNVLSKAFWNALQALANLKWYSLGDSISTHEHVERWFDLRQTQLVFSGRHFENPETMKKHKNKNKFEHVNLHVQKNKKSWTLHFGCSRRRSIGSSSTVHHFTLASTSKYGPPGFGECLSGVIGPQTFDFVPGSLNSRFYVFVSNRMQR